MKFDKLKEYEVGNKSIVKWLMVSNVVLGIVLLFALFIAMGNKTRVVLVPPHLDERLEVAYSSADEKYYTSYAYFFTLLIANSNPSNARYIIENLEAALSPALWSELRSGLLEEAKKLEAESSSIAFVATGKPVFDATTNITCIPGRETKTTALGNQESLTVIYRMKILMNRGMPQIDMLKKEIVRNTKSCR